MNKARTMPNQIDCDIPPWLRGKKLPNGFWGQPENRRNYMNWLGNVLEFKEPQDWYRLTRADIETNKGSGFFDFYGGSRLAVLREQFPDFDWKEWLFGRASNSFWHNIRNCRRYLEWLQGELHFSRTDDWYHVSKKAFEENFGAGLLDVFGNSPAQIIEQCLPEHCWKPWLFDRVRNGFWLDQENRIRYLLWLGELLNFSTVQDWHGLRAEHFIENFGGSVFNNIYNCSPIKAVRELYPEHDWKEWLFHRVPDHFWSDIRNFRRYMQWLGDQLGFEDAEDWYAIRKADFERLNGAGLLMHQFGNSPSSAAVAFYPDYPWEIEKFSHPKEGFWTSKENRISFLEEMARNLGFDSAEDWYQVKQKDFVKYNGMGLLNHYYDGSPAKAVKELLPGYDWKEWLFDKAPNTFWENLSNHRRYMNWLGERLGFVEPHDWYRVSKEDFQNNSGEGMLKNYYNSSPSCAVKAHLPNIEWHEWLFGTAPQRFWLDPSNHRRFMKWLEIQLDIRVPEDWYRVTSDDFQRHNGGVFLAERFDGSPSAAIKAFIPDYPWKEWLFNSLPRGFFDTHENRQRYMTWLGENLGFTQHSDWYDLRKEHFVETGGMVLLKSYYEGSPAKAVKEHFPSQSWLEWKFVQVAGGYWNDRTNRIRYMDWLGKERGYSNTDDWYKVTKKMLQDSEGGGLLSYFGNDRGRLLRDYLPEHDWKDWLFVQAPSEFWRNSTNRIRYLEWLSIRLDFSIESDWYRITKQDYVRNNGGGLLDFYGGVSSLGPLELFPDFQWEMHSFSSGLKKQRRLFKIVKDFYKDREVLWNFKNPKMLFANTGFRMELDIYVPDAQLAFEYQGEQHSLPIMAWGGLQALLGVQKRDEEKRLKCIELGITLIEIPHTWDGSKDLITAYLENHVTCTNKSFHVNRIG